MESSAEEEYAAFEEKVKRSVYVDNLSHHVTEPVLRSAFDQFGTINNIYFIPNYLHPNQPLAALLEMQNPKLANDIIDLTSNLPFMVSGMPRPVRAKPAQPHMFDDRPRKPNKTIQLRWLDPTHPDFQVANRLKTLVRKHDAEASFVRKKQLDEEEKLGNEHSQTLKSHYKKFEMIENVVGDGSVDKLAHRYKMNISAGTGRDAS